MDVLREFVDEGPQGRRRLPTLSAEERDELGLPSEADDDGDWQDDLDPNRVQSEEPEALRA
jgi:hypothetical protein